ncbi:AraC family transcriptional regulator [Metabacillus niabensis]|uniref:AraC family transcriptional regulator n=1 Tax=Metabacillus niabensis TaxID=324854 RepID=UPI0039A3B18B
MEQHHHCETYGFRFLDTLNGPFCQLFAVGHDLISNIEQYHWDGRKRVDGPLLLFQYTISGFGHLDIDEKTYKIMPGYAFMVEIPSDHIYYLPEESNSWEFYYILVRPTGIIHHWNELVGKIGRVIKINNDHSVISLLQNIFHAASRQQITDGYRAASIVYQFIMELFRFSDEHKKMKSNWPVKIQKAVEKMEKDYAYIQSLEEIAIEVEISKYHFIRIFKQSTGYTPIEYLTKVRMEKAVNLLRQSELTIDEIAKLIGYSNGSYFIKVFRKWLGFSPGEFRDGKDIASVNQLKFD